MTREWRHLVTGKLAAQALEEVVAPLAADLGFDYSIQILPITVAGLMTPQWAANHIEVPEQATQVVLPGYCLGDREPLEKLTSCPLVVGPKDLRELPSFWGAGHQQRLKDYGAYAIEIIAEINHAPRMTMADIQSKASHWVRQGADVIDIGCVPGETWKGLGDCVRALTESGVRVSVDSMNVEEITAAVKAGAELVLSVSKANRDAAADWGCEVVAIPDDTSDLMSLAETVDFLDQRNVSYRVDPIIEPIGFGFAESIQRYVACRQRYPETPMMMGIGNLTELTDCDSAGINLTLLAICEELGIHSVLTTEVINWARSAVRECDIGRRLVHYAVSRRQLPKHIDDRLIILRDPALFEQGADQLERLTQELRDQNLRVYAEGGELHLLANGRRLSGTNPFDLFRDVESLCAQRAMRDLSPSHAFYLGYELCKASIALQLGKQYRQDESLRWGFLQKQARET